MSEPTTYRSAASGGGWLDGAKQASGWLSATGDSVLRVTLLSSEKLFYLYFALLVVLLWYKANLYVYPGLALLQELLLSCCLLLLQLSRLYVGRRAWRMESGLLLALFVWLGLPVAFLIGYHLNFQVYVLRIEVISGGVLCCLVALEVLSALAAGLPKTEAREEGLLLAMGCVFSVGMLVFNAVYHSMLVP
eukprot:TRINITY_DN25320_c0_g1_i2.p1 TRINITY_DN25320_c0_g1~~TRINITY_DN25320_c0_g1_i2.p1  ORF type:complete len:191 (-),score=35.13 TRINITY_DN25320_c0_g1_i2:614-1186(-)